MIKQKKKILWISDYSYSGYTLVTDCLLKSIINEYEIYLFVINNGIERPKLIKHIQKSLPLDEEHIYNTDLIHNIELNILSGAYKLKKIIEIINPYIIFSINDLQMLNLQINEINDCYWHGITVAYMPVDAENYRYGFFEALSKFNHVITMNQNSKKIIRNSGFYNHIYVLEHPIRSSFFPLKDKKKLRYKFFDNIDNNTIVIMNANVNNLRKRLDLTIEAFYLLHTKNKTNNFLLVLKTTQDGSFNIVNLIEQNNTKYNLNLQDKIIVYDKKLNYEELNEFYNCADIYVTTTSGEGWGLTAFEFLKNNIYTIVPNNISYTNYFDEELLIKIKKDTINYGRYLHKKHDFEFGYITLLTGSLYNEFNFKINKNLQNLNTKNNYIITSNISDLNEVINDLTNKIKNNIKVNKFNIILKINMNGDFLIEEKIMKEFYLLTQKKLKNIFKNYKIEINDPSCIDGYITKVKIPLIEDICNKILFYINNQEKCKNNIKKYSNEILKKLNNQIIINNFINILNDIN